MSSLTASVDALAEPTWIDGADDGGARPAPAAGRPRCRKRLLLAVAAIVGVLAGAVASALLVTAAFVSAAEDIGRGMSEGFGSVRASLAAPEEAAGSAAGAVDAVERYPAAEPGHLGEDPALDATARSCFAGDLSACDVLWAESAPMSSYEQYAATCGGRVKRDAVPACTDLD
jgi:hypothetical protein